MAKCAFNYGDSCDAIATTTLMKNDGRIEQLCERHHDFLIKLFKRVAAGEQITEREDADMEANHWLVKNKIRS